MKKKAQAGLDFMKSFAVGLFILIVILMTIAIAGSNLRQTASTTAHANATDGTAYIGVAGHTLNQSTIIYGFSSPSIISVYNKSNGALITAANYTLTGNVLYNATIDNMSSVNVTYSYSYLATTPASTVMMNLTTSIGRISSSVSTWIILASLVVLISIIVIVVMVVNRMSGTKGGEL